MSRLIPSSPTVSFITETRTTLESPQPGGNRIIGSFQASSILVDRKWVEPDEVQAEIFMPTTWALAHLPSAEAKSVAGKARYIEVAQPIGVSRVFLLEEADVQPLDGGKTAKVSIKGRSPESWLEIVPTTINRSLQEPFSPTDTWADYARTIVDLYSHDGSKYGNSERINGVEFRALPILNLGTDFKSMVVSEMDELGVFAPQMTSLPGKPSIKAGVLPPNMRDLEFPSPAGRKLWDALKSYGYSDGNETLLTSAFELVLVRAESPYKDGTLWWRWAFHPRTDASLFVSTVGGSADGEMVIHVSSTTQQTLAVPPEEGGLTKQSSTYGSAPLIGTWNATTMKTVEVSQAEGRPVTPAERAYFRSIGRPIPDSVTEWTPSLVSLTREQIRREAQAGDLTIAPSVTIDVDANGDSTEIGLKKLSSLRPGMKATVRVATSTLSYEIDEVLYSYESETGWSVKAPLTIKTDAMKISYPYDYTIDSYDKEDEPTPPVTPPQPDFPPYIPVPEPEPPVYPEPPVAPEDPDPSVPIPEPGAGISPMQGAIKYAWGKRASRRAFVQLENGKWLVWNSVYQIGAVKPEIFEIPTLKDATLLGAEIVWGDSDENFLIEGVFKKGKKTFVVVDRPGLEPEEPHEITGREILCASGMVTLDASGLMERQIYDGNKKTWSRKKLEDLMVRCTPELFETTSGTQAVMHNDRFVVFWTPTSDFDTRITYYLDDGERYIKSLIPGLVIATSKGLFAYEQGKWKAFTAPDGPTIETISWDGNSDFGLAFTPDHVYEISYSSSKKTFSFKELVAGHFLGGAIASSDFESVVVWGSSGLYELLLSEDGKTWEKKQITSDAYGSLGWAEWTSEVVGLHPGWWTTVIISQDGKTVRWRATQTVTEATLWSAEKSLSFKAEKMETTQIYASAFWSAKGGSVFILTPKPGTDASYDIDQQDVMATNDIQQILTIPGSKTAAVSDGETLTLPDGTDPLADTIAAEAKPRSLALSSNGALLMGSDRGAYELSMPRKNEEQEDWLKRVARVSRLSPSVAEIQAIGKTAIIGKEEAWRGLFTSSTQLMALKDGEKIWGSIVTDAHGAVFFLRKDGIYRLDPHDNDPIHKMSEMPIALRTMEINKTTTTPRGDIVWYGPHGWMILNADQQLKDKIEDGTLIYATSPSETIREIVPASTDTDIYAILDDGSVRYLNATKSDDHQLGLYRVFEPEIKAKTMIPDPLNYDRTMLIQTTDGSWHSTKTTLQPLGNSTWRMTLEPLNITGDIIDRTERVLSTTDGLWMLDEARQKWNATNQTYEDDPTMRQKVSVAPSQSLIASTTVLLGKDRGVVLTYSSHSEPSNHAPYYRLDWKVDERITGFKGWSKWHRVGGSSIFVQETDGSLSILDAEAYSGSYRTAISTDLRIDWNKTTKIQVSRTAEASAQTWGVFTEAGQLAFLGREGGTTIPTTLQDSSVISKIWSSDLDDGVWVIYETSGGLYRAEVPRLTPFAARPMGFFVSWSPRSMELVKQAQSDETRYDDLRVSFLGGLMLFTGVIYKRSDGPFDWSTKDIFAGDDNTSIVESYAVGQQVTSNRISDAVTLQGRKGLVAWSRSKIDSDLFVRQTFATRTRLATQLPTHTTATDQTAMPALLVMPAWKEDESDDLKPESLAMLAAKDSDGDGKQLDFQLVQDLGVKPSGVYAGVFPSGTLDGRTGLITTDGASTILIRAGWNGKTWTHTQTTIQQGMVPALLTSQAEDDEFEFGSRDGSHIFAVAEDGTTSRLDRSRQGVWTPVSLGKIDGLASPTGSCGVATGALDAIDEAWGPLIWSGSAIYTSIDGLTLEDWTSAFEPFTQEEETNGN